MSTETTVDAETTWAEQHWTGSAEALAVLMRDEKPVAEGDPDLYDRLVAEIGHDNASKLWRSACSVIDRNGEVDEKRKQLREALADARAALAAAVVAHGQLCSDRLYDVEFAEGSGDLAAFLADAGRATRAAWLFFEQAADA